VHLTLRRWFEGLQPSMVTDAEHQDSKQRGLVLVAISLLSTIALGVAAATNALVRQYMVAGLFAAASVWAFVAFAGFRRHGRLRLAGHQVAAAIFLALGGSNFVTGGFGLPAHFNIGLVSLAAFMSLGQRAGLLWALICGAGARRPRRDPKLETPRDEDTGRRAYGERYARRPCALPGRWHERLFEQTP
jgi:hypothetical protein